MISSGLPSPVCGEVIGMLDVLVPIVFAGAVASGVMCLADWIDRPRQKKSRARGGARARREA